MPFETPHDDNGIRLMWNPTTNTATTSASYVYTVTNIVVSFTDPTTQDDKINVAHLGQTVGETAKTLDLPLAGSVSGDTGRSVQFDYVGRTLIEDRQTGYFYIQYGPNTGTNLIFKPGTVQSSTLTLAAQDAIRGQATIRIAR